MNEDQASVTQINYLYNLLIKHGLDSKQRLGLTKAEASKMINKLKKSKAKKNDDI